MSAAWRHTGEGADPHVATAVAGIASTFELAAAALVCGQNHYSCDGINAYAVAVGAVSLAFIAPIALVLFAEPLAPRRLPEGLPHLSLLLLLWWVPAGFLLTFVGPFQALSNGYCGALAGVASALMLCRAHVPVVDVAANQLLALARDAPSERTVLVSLALTSTAVWVQAAICVGQAPEHAAIKAWAIIVGVVSFLICVFYLLLDEAPRHRVGFALLLAAWWMQGVALSFVPSSFMATLNGFGFTWASVLLAFYFLRSNEVTRELIPPAEPADDGEPTTTYLAAADAVVDASDGAFPSSYEHGGPTWTIKPQAEAERLGNASDA